MNKIAGWAVDIIVGTFTGAVLFGAVATLLMVFSGRPVSVQGAVEGLAILVGIVWGIHAMRQWRAARADKLDPVNPYESVL